MVKDYYLSTNQFCGITFFFNDLMISVLLGLNEYKKDLEGIKRDAS